MLAHHSVLQKRTDVLHLLSSPHYRSLTTKLRVHVCALCAIVNNASYLYLSKTTEHRSLEVTVLNVVKKVSRYVSWEPKVYYYIQKISPQIFCLLF